MFRHEHLCNLDGMAMRTLLIILLCVSATLRSQAQLNIGSPFYVAGVLKPSGAAAPTYLVNQNFETATTGYDNGETWNETGTQNHADTSSPLVGSQSWSSSTIAAESWTSFTGQSTVYVYATGKFAVLDNVVEVFEVRDSTGTYVTRVRLLNDGSMRIVNFATSATSAAGLVTAGTQFHMWIHYTKGTGADSTSDIYISSTSTKPGSPSASITGAGSTTDAARVAVMSWNGGKYQWDKVLVDDVVIGSNP